MTLDLLTWRIILVTKWLVTPIYKPWKGHLNGEQPYLGDLLTMVVNHLLDKMILQVPVYGLEILDHISILGYLGMCQESRMEFS